MGNDEKYLIELRDCFTGGFSRNYRPSLLLSVAFLFSP